jgi:hypothetical protein
VVELPAVLDVSIQTDAFLARPETPPFVPPKIGVDIQTQVEEDQLFDFDFEVQPIVATIIGKTIEQAFMEVHEEEEFAAIRRNKEAIECKRNNDLADILCLEEAESRKFEEKQRRIEERLVFESAQHELRERIAARGFGEFFASDLIADALTLLERRGYFYDEVERAIELNFLPWLTNAIGNPEQVHAIQNLIIRRMQSAVVKYEKKLRVEVEQEIDAKTEQGTTAKNVLFRQMLIEDLGSIKIRAARAAAKPKSKQGEEEDEGHDE